MNVEEMKEYVIKEARKNRRPDQIALDLAERSGHSYTQTMPFVRKVIATNQDKVANNPLLIVVGVLTLIAGVGGVITVLYFTMTGWILVIGGVPYLGNGLACVASGGMLVGGLQGLLQIFLKPARRR